MTKTLQNSLSSRAKNSILFYRSLMIKIGNKTLKNKENIKKLSINSFYLLWAIFSISISFRLFKVTKPNFFFLNEQDTFEDFSNISLNKFQFNGKPLFGRYLLFKIYNILNFNSINDFKFESFPNFYLFRLINSIISSLIPPIISLILLLNNISFSSSFLSGFILSIEPSNIIISKEINTESFFLFFFSLTLLLLTILTKKSSIFLKILIIIFSIITISIDYLGILLFIYIFFLKIQLNIKFIILSFLIFYISLETSLEFTLNQEIQLIAPFISLLPMYYFLKIFNSLKPIFLFKFSKLERITYWFFIKLRPQILFKDSNSRLVILNNIVSIVILSFSSFLGIFNLNSIFYWLSIIFIYFFKPLLINSYQLPLIFGCLSIGYNFNDLPKPIRIISLICLIILILLNFIIYFPWIYSIPISTQMDNDIDLWK